MVYMRKLDVHYGLDAFKLRGEDTRQQLEAAVRAAERSVIHGGHGKWIIHTMDLVLDGDRPRLELALLILPGRHQSEEIFDVLTFFEAAVARELGAPVDQKFRTFGHDDAKCEVCGSEEVDSIRTNRDPLFSDSNYFCINHALEQKDFPLHGQSSFYWHVPA